MNAERNVVIPQRLVPGDTVAVLSPSWGGPSCFPHVYALGLRNLQEAFGLQIREYPTARMDAQELYHNPQRRAEDINTAFADVEVRAILASIGGDDSVRILPFLDEEILRRNPKILMGYSDTTTLLTYLNHRLGLITFNGPSVMAGFAQLRHLPSDFARHVRFLLMEPAPTYLYRPYGVWTERYVDWSTPGYDGEIMPLQGDEPGWQWLQGQGVVSGRLFGGCIEVLEFMKSTHFWPAPEFWQGRILFLETSEDKPTVSQVKWMLRNYGMQGVFDRIMALLIGRARDYTTEETRALYQQVVEVVNGEFGRSDLPVVANMDFGHTDPQFILPLGVLAEVDCNLKQFRLVEPAVV
ncbi:MAG TPA: S66 peptidase family protein [Chthonomonadaceae bacterium]|nr:S66 peptidase family protein [Chthonomonadaceae bacterium]